jgi:hypothetical protein
MNKGIIYKYTSPSGKVYFGKTINPSVRKEDIFLDLLKLKQNLVQL